MLSGKRIVVFGAAGLIGREIVEKIIALNGRVVAADIRLEDLQTHDSSESVDYEVCDFNNKGDLDRLFSRYDDISGVVNTCYPRNKSYGTDFLDVDLNSFNENVSLNLGGAFLVLQKSAEYFLKNKKKLSIVNIASIYGVVAPDFSIYSNTEMTMPVEYSAIKSALLHLGNYVNSYVNHSDFRVNSVSPGGIKDRQPEGFLSAYQSLTRGTGMLSAKDMTGAIAFLLSDESEFMVGQNLIIDDGFCL